MTIHGTSWLLLDHPRHKLQQPCPLSINTISTNTNTVSSCPSDPSSDLRVPEPPPNGTTLLELAELSPERPSTSSNARLQLHIVNVNSVDLENEECNGKVRNGTQPTQISKKREVKKETMPFQYSLECKKIAAFRQNIRFFEVLTPKKNSLQIRFVNCA